MCFILSECEWEHVCVCVGLYKMHQRLRQEQLFWSKKLKPHDLDEYEAFSQWNTCWDSQMENEGKRWIDLVRLITFTPPDLNKRNPKKGLIHLADLLFLIESNYFISLVNIISWLWRLWHVYRSVTLLHASKAFESTHGKFSEALVTHGIKHLLEAPKPPTPRSDPIDPSKKQNRENSRKWSFNSTSDLDADWANKNLEREISASSSLHHFLCSFFFFPSCGLLHIPDISVVNTFLFYK